MATVHILRTNTFTEQDKCAEIPFTPFTPLIEALIPATCGSGFWGALNFRVLAGKVTGGGMAPLELAEPRQH
jgi:hypothetical protein